MTDWQDKVNKGMKELNEKQEAMMASSQEGVATAIDSFEKLARFQMEVANDAVNAAIALFKLLGQAGKPADYIEAQIALVSESVQNASARASELADLMTSSASEITSLYGKSAGKGK